MLPRTLSEMANTFSSAVPASDDPALSGAGSAAKQPGGSTKPLDANNRITVRHVAGTQILAATRAATRIRAMEQATYH